MPYAKKGKKQLTVFFDFEVQEVLKRYVGTKLNCSVSSFVNSLVKAELIRLGEMKDLDADTVAELVAKNYDYLLKETEIPKVILDQVKQGSRPDDITLLRIHGALQIPESDLREMVAKTSYGDKKMLNTALNKAKTYRKPIS